VSPSDIEDAAEGVNDIEYKQRELSENSDQFRWSAVQSWLSSRPYICRQEDSAASSHCWGALSYNEIRSSNILLDDGRYKEEGRTYAD
jgi:hypothetical protein